MLSKINSLSNDREKARLLLAVNSLAVRGGQDFEVITEFLQSCLESQDKQNRRADGPDMHRGQGKALALEDILELFTNYQDTLREVSQRTSR